jgi:hypothetical protein
MEVRMKRTYDKSSVLSLFIKAGLIAALAAILLAPSKIKASGGDALRRAEPQLKGSSSAALPLPPIKFLETMSWLDRDRTPKLFKIDTLLGPKFELMRLETADGRVAPPLEAK